MRRLVKSLRHDDPRLLFFFCDKIHHTYRHQNGNTSNRKATQVPDTGVLPVLKNLNTQRVCRNTLPSPPPPPLRSRLTVTLRSISPQVVQPLLQVGVSVGQGGLRLRLLSGGRWQTPAGAGQIWKESRAGVTWVWLVRPTWFWWLFSYLTARLRGWDPARPALGTRWHRWG